MFEMIIQEIQNAPELFNIVILFAGGIFLLVLAFCVLKRQKSKRLKTLDSFNNNQETLVFTLPNGIEGIDAFKPNYRTQIELFPTEIRLSEMGTGHYSANLKSVSLAYSQISDVDIIKLEESVSKTVPPQNQSASNVSSAMTPYCCISYRSKDGEEKQLRFKITLTFGGDIHLFIQALKSRITTQAPTNYEL